MCVHVCVTSALHEGPDCHSVTDRSADGRVNLSVCRLAPLLSYNTRCNAFQAMWLYINFKKKSLYLKKQKWRQIFYKQDSILKAITLQRVMVIFRKDTFEFCETLHMDVSVDKYIFVDGGYYQSPRPLSLRLFLVSLVMSGAAGHGVWLTLPSEAPAPTPVFSCDSAVSSRDGVWLSLSSGSTAPPKAPSAPPSSGGNRLKTKWIWLKM